VCTTPFLYSAAISDESVLASYIDDTDYLFGVTGSSSDTSSSDTNDHKDSSSGGCFISSARI
jgi:hypothetical protein